jgi:hypothetical protein
MIHELSGEFSGKSLRFCITKIITVVYSRRHREDRNSSVSRQKNIVSQLSNFNYLMLTWDTTQPHSAQQLAVVAGPGPSRVCSARQKALH